MSINIVALLVLFVKLKYVVVIFVRFIPICLAISSLYKMRYAMTLENSALIASNGDRIMTITPVVKLLTVWLSTKGAWDLITDTKDMLLAYGSNNSPANPLRDNSKSSYTEPDHTFVPCSIVVRAHVLPLPGKLDSRVNLLVETKV